MIRRLTPLVALLLVVATSIASAAWLAATEADVAAVADELAAPDEVTATAVGDVATVSWTAPSSGPAPHGFFVRRTPAGGACEGPTTETSCVDPALAPGTYTYAVSTTLVDWESHQQTSASVVVVQVLPPEEPTAFHVEALVDRSEDDTPNTWTARINALVVDDNEHPTPGVELTLAWTWVRGSNATSTTTGEVHCTTGQDGRCEVAVSGVPEGASEVTFEVLGARCVPDGPCDGLEHDDAHPHDVDTAVAENPSSGNGSELSTADLEAIATTSRLREAP